MAAYRSSGGNRGLQYLEWIKEVENIQKSRDDDEVAEEDIVPEVADDDQDQAAAFLSEVGLGDGGDPEMDRELASVLTMKQVATIKKRLETVRSKAKSHRPDVRDVFSPGSPKSPGDDVRSPMTEHDGSCASKGRTDDGNCEIYIPPPDYNIIEESLVNIGLQGIHMARPNSIGTLVLSPVAKDNKRLSLQSIVDPGRSYSPLPAFFPNNGRSSPMLGGTTETFEEGVTRIDDLGRKDLKTLSSIAKIELMSLMDEHRIVYVRHKSKKKVRDHGVFGVPLQTLLDRDRKKSVDQNVPAFFQQLVQHLEKKGLKEEGLLRISGAMLRIKELLQLINDQWPNGKFSFEEVQLHDAAGLMKHFLRDLPEPLLTLEKVDAFLKILDIADEKKRTYALNLLILALPEVNRNTLQVLLSFLRKVVMETENRMTIYSVSMIIAPNLFVYGTGGAQRNKPFDMEKELQMAAKTSEIVTMLIDSQDDLWIVPTALMSQIRQKNEDSRKSKMKIPVLGKKSDRSDVYRLSQAPAPDKFCVIPVSTEDSSNEILISINENTTSSDVITKVVLSPDLKAKLVLTPDLKRKNQKSNSVQATPQRNDGSSSTKHERTLPSRESSYLYEVGGNIGERRLDHQTNMMSVHQVNPNAKFVIRTKLV